FAFHRALAADVYLPYLTIVQPLVFLAELAFAILLMLGFAVRLVAIVAVLYALHRWLGLYREASDWPWEFIFLAVVHALFVVQAAGRSLGADALLRRRADPNRLIGRFVALCG